MANEILQKSRTRITAQENTTAFTADEDPNSGSYTGATPATIDNSIGTTNGDGSEWLNLELAVTSTDHSAATADIYYRGSEDGGSTWTKWKYSHTVGDDIIAATADLYDAGMFYMTYQSIQLAVVAVDAGFNANLLATPKLMEVQ